MVSSGWSLRRLCDPHKWLYAPLEAGCALVRDQDALRAAFAYHPPCCHFEERATHYVDYGPPNSRGLRALKGWLSLKHVGAAGYRKMIADELRLSQAMATVIGRHAELELTQTRASPRSATCRAIFERTCERQWLNVISMRSTASCSIDCGAAWGIRL